MKPSPETTPESAIARTQTSTTLAPKPEQLKQKRRYTLDVASIARLKEVLCMLNSEIYTIEMPPMAKDAPPSQAHAVDIVDLLRSQEYVLILNSVMLSALDRAGKPLTGRYFAFRGGEIKAGKRYRQVDVIELERAE